MPAVTFGTTWARFARKGVGQSMQNTGCAMMSCGCLSPFMRKSDRSRWGHSTLACDDFRVPPIVFGDHRPFKNSELDVEQCCVTVAPSRFRCPHPSPKRCQHRGRRAKVVGPDRIHFEMAPDHQVNPLVAIHWPGELL